LPGKTKVEQHLAIVDHFFETPNLKSAKSQKAQSDNDDKFNALLERAQKKIEAQIAQSQQIFEHVTNNFLERIIAAQQLAPTTNHDNEVTKQLVKEVVEELGGKWVDVVKKMGKQMDNFVSQGEARERSTCSCNARIIRFDETEGETTQQLLDKVNSQVLQGQMKLAIKAVVVVCQPLSKRAETNPGTVRTRAVLVTFATAEDKKPVC
jgi:predicted SpoU family rRNA methylase